MEPEKEGLVRGDQEKMARGAQNAGEKRSFFSFVFQTSRLSLALQDESNKKPDIKLNVPEALKMFLVDDWEAVTKNNQVRI